MNVAPEQNFMNGMTEQEVFTFLIDSYRLRQYDEYTLTVCLGFMSKLGPFDASNTLKLMKDVRMS